MWSPARCSLILKGPLTTVGRRLSCDVAASAGVILPKIFFGIHVVVLSAKNGTTPGSRWLNWMRTVVESTALALTNGSTPSTLAAVVNQDPNAGSAARL